MHLTVMPLTRYHLTEVTKLEQAAFSDPWTYAMFAECLNDPLSHYLVVLDGMTLVGYAGGQAIAGDFEIESIAVAEDRRRQGIGALLLEKLLEMAKELNQSKVFLEVRASNAPAIALYRRFGFGDIGLRKDYYQKPREDALLMGLTIEGEQK